MEERGTETKLKVSLLGYHRVVWQLHPSVSNQPDASNFRSKRDKIQSNIFLLILRTWNLKGLPSLDFKKKILRDFEIIHTVHLAILNLYLPISARQFNIYIYSTTFPTCFGAICTNFRRL
jgi:hypothetical protein